MFEVWDVWLDSLPWWQLGLLMFGTLTVVLSLFAWHTTTLSDDERSIYEASKEGKES